VSGAISMLLAPGQRGWQGPFGRRVGA
jgi:hypothetical protein